MIRLILQILGIIFLFIIFQYIRAYFTTKEGECQGLGVSYFPLNTIVVCKGENVQNTNTPII